MLTKPTSVAAVVAFGAALILGGCKNSTPPAAPVQSTNPNGTATQPTDTTTTAAPAPASSPVPAPITQGAVQPSQPSAAPPPTVAVAPPVSTVAAPPAPVRVTARAGTPVIVTVTEQLSASHNEIGDRFTGVLAESVKSTGGGAIFPRGARVAGTVTAAKGRGKFKGAGALAIQVTSIAGTPVSVSNYEKEAKGKGKRSAGFIGGGAGGGALIGGLAGGGKGALLGGLLGAGAGTAGAAFTGNKDVVIPSESTITFHLTAPVTVSRR